MKFCQPEGLYQKQLALGILSKYFLTFIAIEHKKQIEKLPKTIYGTNTLAERHTEMSSDLLFSRRLQLFITQHEARF